VDKVATKTTNSVGTIAGKARPEKATGPNHGMWERALLPTPHGDAKGKKREGQRGVTTEAVPRPQLRPLVAEASEECKVTVASKRDSALRVLAGGIFMGWVGMFVMQYDAGISGKVVALRCLQTRR